MGDRCLASALKKETTGKKKKKKKKKTQKICQGTATTAGLNGKTGEQYIKK